MEAPQLTYNLEPPKALPGMFADTGARKTLSRAASVALNAGIFVAGDETVAHPPASASDVSTDVLGVSVADLMAREPATPSYAVYDAVPVLETGTIWVSLLGSADPGANDPVYCYRGATAADRGKVTQDYAHSSVTLVSGAYFTGRVTDDGDTAEVCVRKSPAVGQTGQVQYETVTLTTADFTAAALTQTYDIGTQLPAGAKVITREVIRTTALSGTGITDVKAEIGTVGDPDAIMTSLDVDTGTGTALKGSDGVNPEGSYGGLTLKLKLTAVGANISAIDAGEVTVNVGYVVP